MKKFTSFPWGERFGVAIGREVGCMVAIFEDKRTADDCRDALNDTLMSYVEGEALAQL